MIVLAELVRLSESNAKSSKDKLENLSKNKKERANDDLGGYLYHKEKETKEEKIKKEKEKTHGK